MRKLFGILLVVFLFVSPVYAGTIDTSGVTAQSIIDRVRATFNEDTARFLTDSTHLVYWIDEAVSRIALKTKCLESGASTIVVYSGDRDYEITSDFLCVVKVEFDLGASGNTVYENQVYDLDRVPWPELKYGKEKLKTGADPKNYSVWNNTLYVYPIPGSDQNGKSLYLYTVDYPTGVTNTLSSIETPLYFDEAIVNYVLAKAYFRDGRPQTGNYYMSLFEAVVDEYAAKIQQRQIVK